MKEPNYSLADLPARALAARATLAGYISDLERDFARREWQRYDDGVRSFALCGMGRAGKDESAKRLCNQLGTKYGGSLSEIILPMVAAMAEAPRDIVFAERHSHRDFWIHACHAIRGHDYGCLVRWGLGAGDAATGIRGLEEMRTVRRHRIAKVLIWIDNPRVPVDPTTEYGPELCDIVIPNYGTLYELYERLAFIAPLIRSK